MTDLAAPARVTSNNATRLDPVATIVHLDGELDWKPFDIPGGTEPVSMVQLRAEADTRAITVLVRFPDGWRRPVCGYYEASEDVVFLTGTLEMDGIRYRPGDWAHIPAGSARAGTTARPQVTALARFGGPARWRLGDHVSNEPVLHRKLVVGGLPARSPLGNGYAMLLRRGAPDSSWLVDAPEPGAPSPIDVELLDLHARIWAWVPAGAPLPEFSGALFARTFG